MDMDEVKILAKAIAQANRHPDPDAYAQAVVSAVEAGVAYPDEVEQPSSDIEE